MIAKANVLKQVADLPGMTTPDLKKMWKNLYDRDPPPYNKGFLVKRLAYRLQELAYGGLSEIADERLQALAKDEERIARRPVHENPDGRPITGTRLIREWKGVEHCVTVLDDNFEYQGRKYRSLSAAARAITGTRWNGKLFFGLKKHGVGK